MSSVRCTLLLLLAATASAQDPLTPRQILDHVRDAYTNVRQYEIAGRIEVTKPRLIAPFRMVYRYPDKLRMEGSARGMAGNQSGGTLVTDGRTTWTYEPARMTYMQLAGPPDLDTDMDDDELKQLGIDPSGPELVQFAELQLAHYRQLAALAASASLLRVESVQLAGAPVDCYVVQARDNQDTHVLWIDTKQFRVLRMESTGGQTTMRLSFDQVKLNEPAPDDVFSFVPPTGAKLADQQRR